MKYKFILLSIFILTSFSSELFSQFYIEVKPTETIYNTDISYFPFLTAKIKAYNNGNIIKLKKQNMVILERKAPGEDITMNTMPVSITDDGEGWQEVKWESNMEISNNSSLMVATYDSNTSSAELIIPSFSIPLVIAKDHKTNEETSRIEFGQFVEGKLNFKQLWILPLKGINTGNGEYPFSVDSLTIDSPYFTYLWQGSTFDRTKPPVTVAMGAQYLMDVYFNPPNNDYYEAVLTIHYAGGIKKNIYLSGGYTGVEKEKILELTSPVAGQNLTPCEDLIIKWKGHTKELPTIIEVSYNAGKSWNFIASVQDSMYQWKVPEVLSDSVLFRVYQRYAETSIEEFNPDKSGVYSISFNSNGSLLALGTMKGKVHIWDVASKSITKSFDNNLVDYPGSFRRHSGLGFINNDTKVAALYKQNDGYGFQEEDIFVIYDINSGSIEEQRKFSSYRAKRMKIDREQKYIAFVPQFGNELVIWDASTYNEVKKLIFDVPVTGMDFNEKDDQIVVSLLNSDVQIYSYPSFNLIKSYEYDRLPIIEEITSSPNGKLIALGIKSTGRGGNILHPVLKSESGVIMDELGIASSDPVELDFSPSSSMLLIGSMSQPQLSFFDLTNNSLIATMSGGAGQLTDVEFSPQSSSIATATNAGQLTYRSFTYPEMDTTDGLLSIKKPEININVAEFEAQFIGTSQEKLFTTSLCNEGEVPFYIYDVNLKSGIHYTIINTSVPDTVFPGECRDIIVNFHPLDTGMVKDTIIFKSCNYEYLVVLEGYSKNRNISLVQAPVDFGEVCIGESLSKKITLRNDDPVPLKVNKLKSNKEIFRPENNTDDSVIEPGGIYEADIVFTPDTLGSLTGELLIYHSDQSNVIKINELTGIGIGTFVDISHDKLYFIPEIPERTITIKNNGEKTVTIHNITLEDDTKFEIISSLPIVIPTGASGEIKVRQLDRNIKPLDLILHTEPCVVQNRIELGNYNAYANIIIPDVKVKSTEDAVIPVYFDASENTPYKGERFFEIELNTNPRLYLPLKVTSAHGSGSIIRSEIRGDRRFFTIRVEGNFPDSGKVADIIGVPGLSDTDTTNINVNFNSLFWGEAVDVNSDPGLLTIDDGSKDRKIIRQDNSIMISSIKPNPATDIVTLDLELKDNINYIIEITDLYGNKVMEVSEMAGTRGINTITLNVQSLPPGSYKILLKGAGIINSGALTIIR